MEAPKGGGPEGWGPEGCAGLQNTTKIQRKDPQERKKELKIVADLGGPAEEGSEGGEVRRKGVRWERVGRRAVGGSAQILDAPTKILNTHPTDTPHNTHHTPHTHNTTHNTQHNTTHKNMSGQNLCKQV